MVNEHADLLTWLIIIGVSIIGFFLAQIYFQIKEIGTTVSEMKGAQMVNAEKFKNMEYEINWLKRNFIAKHESNNE